MSLPNDTSVLGSSNNALAPICLDLLQSAAHLVQQLFIAPSNLLHTDSLESSVVNRDTEHVKYFQPQDLSTYVQHLEQIQQTQRFLNRQWCFEYLTSALRSPGTLWQLSCTLNAHDTWCLDRSVILWDTSKIQSASSLDIYSSLRQYHVQQNPQLSKTFFHFLNSHSGLIARLVHSNPFRLAPNILKPFHERIYEHYIDPQDALVWIGPQDIELLKTLFFTEQECAWRERCVLEYHIAAQTLPLHQAHPAPSSPYAASDSITLARPHL